LPGGNLFGSCGRSHSSVGGGMQPEQQGAVGENALGGEGMKEKCKGERYA